MTDGLDVDLDSRVGLPAELRSLLDRYPRDLWPGHANLGQTARFWLSRHDMFRDLGGALEATLHRHREGEIDAHAFRGWFAPRLGFFLQQLEGHHRIEDEHYFPVFALAESRLKRGFEILEADHDVIHHDLLLVAETANGFLRTDIAPDARPGDAARRAADAYGAASERLLRRLVRHLGDEEDLIVPLILDRGESAIGI